MNSEHIVGISIPYLHVSIMLSRLPILLAIAHLLLSSVSARPEISYAPRKPFKAMTTSPPRRKTCNIRSNGYGKDDSDNILSALKQCNNGGQVIFNPGATYTIGKVLDMTFLQSIDIGETRSGYTRRRQRA